MEHFANHHELSSLVIFYLKKHIYGTLWRERKLLKTSNISFPPWQSLDWPFTSYCLFRGHLISKRNNSILQNIVNIMEEKNDQTNN